MKHVWILNHYAQEPGGVGGTRHFHLVKHLHKFGWHGTIIAASVDHVSGRQRISLKKEKYFEFIQGVPFLWIKTPEYAGNGGMRILNMLAYAWQVLRPSTTVELARPDIVIGSSVHPFAAMAGAILARRFRVPFIFEVRDLWPQTLIDMGRLSDGGLVTRALRKLERWLYKSSTLIVVLLPYAWKYIVPLGIAKERIVWIPNGVDLSLFPAVVAEEPKSDIFTVMYFGSHGQANGLDTILKAMAELQKMPACRHIHLRLIGDGPLKPALIAQAAMLELHNVNFEDAVPKNEIPSIAAEADAFVIAVLDLPGLYRFGISMNKLFDYLAAQRPIIIASDAINNPVSEAGAGLTVAPGQHLALAEAIVKMSCFTLAERNCMGRKGREFVELNHSLDKLAGRLVEVLEDGLLKYESQS
jgi:glycosyltransferase involved in cell wall biosynthesis